MKINEQLNNARIEKQMSTTEVLKEMKSISLNVKSKIADVRSWFMEDVIPNEFELKMLEIVLDIKEGVFGDYKLFEKTLQPININPNYSTCKKSDTQGKPGGKPKSKGDGIPIIPVNGQCTFHGCNKPATENCHYTGYEQSLFGKGLSQKVSNLFVADLCHDHHIYFDQPKERKSERLSSEFKTCILLSIKRKYDNGNILFKK